MVTFPCKRGKGTIVNSVKTCAIYTVKKTRGRVKFSLGITYRLAAIFDVRRPLYIMNIVIVVKCVNQ